MDGVSLQSLQGQRDTHSGRRRESERERGRWWNEESSSNPLISHFIPLWLQWSCAAWGAMENRIKGMRWWSKGLFWHFQFCVTAQELARFSSPGSWQREAGRRAETCWYTGNQRALFIRTLPRFKRRVRLFVRSIIQAQKPRSDYIPKHQKHRETQEEQSKADLSSFRRVQNFKKKQPLMPYNSSAAILIAVLISEMPGLFLFTQ